MPTSRIRTLAPAFTASMTACAHDAPTGIHVSTNDLDGTRSTIATILCSSIRFALTVSDTTFSGTGSFAVEFRIRTIQDSDDSGFEDSAISDSRIGDGTVRLHG
jgi:hypothetical protein